jgi:hypothetical protein
MAANILAETVNNQVSHNYLDLTVKIDENPWRKQQINQVNVGKSILI